MTELTSEQVALWTQEAEALLKRTRDATTFESVWAGRCYQLGKTDEALREQLRKAKPALLRAAEIFSREMAEPEHKTGWNWRYRYNQNRRYRDALRALAEGEER